MQTGEKLRKIRLRRGLTVDELASICEVSRDYIVLVERDLTSPSVFMFERILAALDTTPSEFYYEPLREQIVFDDEIPLEITWTMRPSIIEIEPSDETPFRSNEEIYYYVLNGTVQVVCDGETYRASTGASIYIKPYMTYKFVSGGRTAARLIAVLVQHKQMFERKETI